MSPVNTNDWYTNAVAMNERSTLLPVAADVRHGVVRRRGDSGLELQNILGIVRGIVRAHGVPRNCRLEFASLGQEGSACAGFEDAPDSFERPFVLLDKSVYQNTEVSDLVPVYSGLGLHEAGHILHTRDGYRRLARGLSKLQTLYQNLWEDERIEELVRLASPGFDGYLQTTKKVLLEQGEPGRAIHRWNELVDMDLINAMIFAFIRLPHRIPPELQAWEAINNECAFETLRLLFPHGPLSETNVAEFADRLELLWHRMRQLYPGTAVEARQLLSRSEMPLADMERVARQLAADVEDRARHGAAAVDGQSAGDAAGSATGRDVCDKILDGAVQMEEIARSQTQESARAVWNDAAERLVNRAILLESTQDTANDRIGRRFGLPDLCRILNALTSVQVPLDAEETAALAAIDSLAVAHIDRWDWGSKRNTIVHRPTALDEDARRRYEEALAQVRPHVIALKAAFAFRHSDRPAIERDRAQGVLDSRKLVAVAIGGSRRIYKRRVIQPATGLAICLLLDESGSMRGVKAATTMQVAVLLAESLHAIPGVELEVYSHTSAAEDDADCMIKHLADSVMRDHRAIGNFAAGHMGNNYDHQAIQTVARLFGRTAKSRRRWMIVISDGQPAGKDYGGDRAISATRDAVAAVRRQGIKVVNVAIEDFRSEDIFGKDFVLKFTEIQSLVGNMRKLIVRLVAGTM